jgi:heme-degrading monooxygenase HmoA
LLARVITLQTPGENFAELVDTAREELPSVREARGFRGFLLLTDRESGRLMTISLWETKEDLAEVEAVARRVRSQALSRVGAPRPPVEVFEVEIRAEITHGGTSG